VLGVKLAFLPVIASMGSDDYDTGDYSGAADLFDVQKTMNVVDPWKAWFNTGTARHSSGDDYTAINDLHRAYDLAEGEEPMVRCRIQINLSISYETSGDYEKITADDYMAQKKALEEALASRAAGEDYDATVIDPYGDGNELTPEQVQDDATTWYSFAERSFATLSTGERKRVLSARALMTDPELLLLDEPASGLDLGGREELVRSLSILAKDPATPVTVMVTHHVEEIPPGFTHALLLRAGTIVAAGPIGQTLTSQNLTRAFGLPLVVEQHGERFTARAVQLG